MKREVHIISYFSLPTDLASEMREWPEFVSGHEYSVELKNVVSGEVVSVGYVEDGDERYVSVRGVGDHLPNSASSMPMQVLVVPHNPRWAEMFDVESAPVTQALGPNAVAVHHIGSTAIRPSTPSRLSTC